MKTYIIYDIEEDKLRTKIFETCKDYGLQHAQYSTFVGELNHNRREEIYLKIKKLIGRKRGKVAIVPVCDKDARLAKAIDTINEGCHEC
ncbi:MAG: CRISPR-associated endonuclease Cas2 [Veillonellaceae bacterium]|jgi:CRISPR-associated protein Cas2|nr:CRISPR-associated endonuclease Cas2 [Veillonellaceae bacterium]